MILGLDHVQLAIPVGGEPEARHFYGKLLGMAEQERPEALRTHGGVWFASGTAMLHLGVEVDFRPARKAHPALLTVDLDALRARLEAAGHATRTDEPLPGFRRFYADDPFGKRLKFLERL